MKDEIKTHFASDPEGLSRRDHECEIIDFSVSVSRLMANALNVLQKCRIAFQNLKGTHDYHDWSANTDCNNSLDS